MDLKTVENFSRSCTSLRSVGKNCKLWKIVQKVGRIGENLQSIFRDQDPILRPLPSSRRFSLWPHLLLLEGRIEKEETNKFRVSYWAFNKSKDGPHPVFYHSPFYYKKPDIYYPSTSFVCIYEYELVIQFNFHFCRILRFVILLSPIDPRKSTR